MCIQKRSVRVHCSVQPEISRQMKKGFLGVQQYTVAKCFPLQNGFLYFASNHRIWWKMKTNERRTLLYICMVCMNYALHPIACLKYCHPLESYFECSQIFVCYHLIHFKYVCVDIKDICILVSNETSTKFKLHIFLVHFSKLSCAQVLFITPYPSWFYGYIF